MRTQTHSQRCRCRRRCCLNSSKATNSQQQHKKKVHFLYILNHFCFVRCFVCLHKFSVFSSFLFFSFLPLLLLLHVVSSFRSAAALSGYCLPCVKQWVWMCVCVCIYVLSVNRHCIHIHSRARMRLYLCEHQVVCMLNASYTLHFDSIGVRDRIVRSFVRVWILKSISCNLSVFISIRVFLSFCLHLRICFCFVRKR